MKIRGEDISSIIEVEGVSKAFGDQTVLSNVNFKVEAGEIVGLLGPNGAGKTTFIRILNGVIKPESGSIFILGYDPVMDGDEIRKFSGIVTESAGLYHQYERRRKLSFLC